MQNITPAQGRHSLTQNSGADAVSFVWIIAAVRRGCPTVKATIYHIAAATEREARRTLAKDHVCFFAGRIRQGVSNA
ncbi:host cell division inhibitor Icd-like protein [Tatumella morbirosei]|uniref:host cell division inhibitor Icd-like protein n=1 Tax=Tatumella morbirosei TaxID=642227 RepID=UPI00090828EB|nr:host cell division inhibitor Icd-like protein [Tatumella morbirosei]